MPHEDRALAFGSRLLAARRRTRQTKERNGAGQDPPCARAVSYPLFKALLHCTRHLKTASLTKRIIPRMASCSANVLIAWTAVSGRGDLRPQIGTQWSKMRAYSELFMSVAFFNTRLTATLLIERELTSAGIHL
jgi:hypothetical protein